MQEIQLQEGKKIYFASDFHFGIPDYDSTRARERLICQWLNDIAPDAQTIFLMGDLFDSWMEYKKVVPKGNVRFLAKLAELADKGIQIIVFTGNHDLWMHGYFEQELGVTVFKRAQEFKINGRIFHLAHGDGLCDREVKYRLMKSILHHPLSQFIYRQLHPDLGLRIADWFSRLGPKHKYRDLQMKEETKEYQLLYAREHMLGHPTDFFVFGHRHIPLIMPLSEQTLFINLGDWITYNTYAVYDGSAIQLLKY